jgi:hypothetical protein
MWQAAPGSWSMDSSRAVSAMLPDARGWHLHLQRRAPRPDLRWTNAAGEVEDTAALSLARLDARGGASAVTLTALTLAPSWHDLSLSGVDLTLGAGVDPTAARQALEASATTGWRHRPPEPPGVGECAGWCAGAGGAVQLAGAGRCDGAAGGFAHRPRPHHATRNNGHSAPGWRRAPGVREPRGRQYGRRRPSRRPGYGKPRYRLLPARATWMHRWCHRPGPRASRRRRRGVPAQGAGDPGESLPADEAARYGLAFPDWTRFPLCPAPSRPTTWTSCSRAASPTGARLKSLTAC